MISIVLYGRNDSYGYNLHKRAALSLNCMAEVLTDPDDELIFVDYNTPDDYPTFPEAIQDTLTPACLRRLRVLRVRPHHHRRFRDRTHLIALEPIARNVAVRRSNPANRWVLSTNTDMIFVPRDGRSLSEHARDRPDGFYHTARFEIPESLWETLPRSRPADAIGQVGAWGHNFYLNEVVRAIDAIRYDGPGDFQLILRSDLIAMAGFDERMLLGWHVDSNISKRLLIKHGAVGDMLPFVLGYHCDHTRQVTPAHRPDKIENDLGAFVDRVDVARLDEQAGIWGLAGEDVEEVRLSDGPGAYVRALALALPEPDASLSPTFPEVGYRTDSFDRVGYDAANVLPFLADLLVNRPADLRLGWFGCRRDLLEQFCRFWTALGDRQPVLVGDTCPALGPDLPEGAHWAPDDTLAAEADVVLFDFGFAPEPPAGQPRDVAQLRALVVVSEALRRTARAEAERLQSGDSEPRLMIAVNAINNRYETLVRTWIAAALTPMRTRIRHGFLRPQPASPWSLLSRMSIGRAGVRNGTGVRAPAGTAGTVVFGPNLDLHPGRYRVRVAFEPVAMPGGRQPFAIQVQDGPFSIGYRAITDEDAARGFADVAFRRAPRRPDDYDEHFVECIVETQGAASLVVTDITMAEDAGPEEQAQPLALMRAGASGTMTFAQGRPVAIRATEGVAGLVCWGPYVYRPAGDRTVKFRLRARGADPLPFEAMGHVEAVVGADTVLARTTFYAAHILAGEILLPFRMPPDAEASEPLEFRLWTEGRADFDLLDVTDAAGHAEPAAPPPRPTRLLARMQTGGAGRRQGGTVVAADGSEGHMVFGPYLNLPDGAYDATIRFTPVPGAEERALVLDVADGAHELGHRALGAADARSGELALRFQVEAATADTLRRIEIRVWVNGRTNLVLHDVLLSGPLDGGPDAGSGQPRLATGT